MNINREVIRMTDSELRSRLMAIRWKIAEITNAKDWRRNTIELWEEELALHNESNRRVWKNESV